MNDESIKIFISGIISSGGVNAVISYFLYSKKLKDQLKYKRNDIIAKEIEKSLQYTRDMVRQLKTQEIFCIEDELLQRGSNVNVFGGECIYPAIFNNWETYNDFFDLIGKCRMNHEKNLSCKTALNIVFIERYIMQLRLYMSEHGDESMLPFWGTLFIYDLQKWQIKMDKRLIKEINKHEFKLESHETFKWKLLRKIEIERQYKNTILYYLLTGKYTRKNKKKVMIINRYLNLFENNKQNQITDSDKSQILE